MKNSRSRQSNNSLFAPTDGHTTLTDSQTVDGNGKIIDTKDIGGDPNRQVFMTQEAAFASLVTVNKPLGLCRPEVKKFRMPSDKMKLPDGYDVYGPPKKKQNNYMKETNRYDQIVYFFDYLDDVFQHDITKAFKNLLEDASKVPEEDPLHFEDPYSAEKLLWYWSQGLEGRDPVNGKRPAVVVDPAKLVQYKRDFEPEVWKNSYSASKISRIIKEFGWGMIPAQPFFFKMLIDKYDFNGNGRLEPREFLFFAIWENYKNYYTCRKHCLRDIIEAKINPLFTFFDCDNDGYINSENLFEGCKYLKRKDEEKYNFYRCEVPKQFNKYYRTHAPNDFILKNFELADGYLNREEFRKGILLGYWERQSNAMFVVDDDSLNKKSDRWDETGKIDKDCQELILMYDKE